MTVKFAVGVPPIACATTTITANLSFSATESKTHSETIAWETERDVVVKAHHKTDMIWTIDEKGSHAKFYSNW